MSEIEWTDRTWKPVRGCSRVSAGCDNCYAMGQARRYDYPAKDGLQRQNEDGEWTEVERARPAGPYEGLTTIRRGKVDWTGMARLVPEMLEQPLRWKRPQRIFVNSMSDLFHESLSNEEIAAVFGVMSAVPQHTFQVLTKRPKRMKEWFEWVTPNELSTIRDAADEMLIRSGCDMGERFRLLYEPTWGTSIPWPLPNVWLGVSCEDQPAADKRLRLLIETPAAVRFVSAEPLLGPIDFAYSCFNGADSFGNMPGLDWGIVGGESGHGARPCKVEWIHSIVRQFKAAEIPLFVKQMGSYAILDPRYDRTVCGAQRRLSDSKGGDPSEWPEDLRVREFP